MTRLAVSAGSAFLYILAFVATALTTPITPEVVLWSAMLGVGLIWLTVTDVSTLRLPDIGTLTLTVVGLAATFRLNPGFLAQHLLAAVGAFAFVILTNAVYHWLRGKDGIGGGDAKLLMAAGAWTGPEGVVGVLLIASLVALAIFAARALVDRGFDRESRLPFGPFLCLAIWIIWLFGPLE
jgi:leader peptidase (prepilin peptidase)/N-methyltransferase